MRFNKKWWKFGKVSENKSNKLKIDKQIKEMTSMSKIISFYSNVSNKFQLFEIKSPMQKDLY